MPFRKRMVRLAPLVASRQKNFHLQYKYGISVLNMMFIIIIVLTTAGIVWRLIGPQADKMATDSTSFINTNVDTMMEGTLFKDVKR